MALSSDESYLAASIGNLNTLAVTAVWSVPSEQLLGIFEGELREILPGTDLLEVHSLTDGGAVRTRVRVQTISIEQQIAVKRLAGYPSNRPPGKWIRSWTRTGKVKCWDHTFNSSEVLLQGATDLQQVVMSSDAHFIVTRSHADVITVWDEETGEKRLDLDHSIDGTSRFGLQFGVPPGEPRVWSLNGAELIIWDPTTGERLESIELPRVFGYAYPSPDGRFLILDEGMINTSLVVYDLESARRVHSIDFRPREKPHFTPDSKTVYCLGLEGCLQVSLEAGAHRTVSTDEHWSGAVGRELLALGTSSGRIVCYDHRSLEEVQRFEFPHVQ